MRCFRYDEHVARDHKVLVSIRRDGTVLGCPILVICMFKIDSVFKEIVVYVRFLLDILKSIKVNKYIYLMSELV